jgi:hypothetical protein
VIGANHILDYVESRTASHVGANARPISVIVVGSAAYPEFSRPDSDVDLLVVYDNETASQISIILETMNFGDGRLRICEMRLFTTDQFASYAFSCDTAKQFAFIRGYFWVLDKSADVRHSVQICIDRYWTEALSTYHSLYVLDVDSTLQSLRYQFTDAQSYLRDPRLRGRNLLLLLRRGELLKDFIGKIWAVECALEAKRQPVKSFDRDDPLLGSIGLLRVFNETRGGRITDTEKYSVPATIKAIIAQLSEAECHTSLLDTMNSIFTARYGMTLMFEPNTAAVPVLWQNGY